MALTAQQRASVRYYTGWSGRFAQFDSALEQALNGADNDAEVQALITNPVTGAPPGLLALLADVDAKLLAAHGRLKAGKVGSIELNGGELTQLRSEGRRFVGRLCAVLGVDRRVDVFGSGGGGSNYIGK